MAILANYMISKASGETLADYLNNKVFAGMKAETLTASAEDIKGFDEYAAKYKQALEVEKAAIQNVK